MKHFFLKNWVTIGLISVGVLWGYLYWRFVGCTSGSCPITSNWHYSVLVGGLLGFVIRDFFPSRDKKEEGDQVNKD